MRPAYISKQNYMEMLVLKCLFLPFIPLGFLSRHLNEFVLKFTKADDVTRPCSNKRRQFSRLPNFHCICTFKSSYQITYIVYLPSCEQYIKYFTVENRKMFPSFIFCPPLIAFHIFKAVTYDARPKMKGDSRQKSSLFLRKDCFFVEHLSSFSAFFVLYGFSIQ